MQVDVDVAKTHDSDYPYPVDGSIRHEVFSRREGWPEPATGSGQRGPRRGTIGKGPQLDSPKITRDLAAA